MHNQRRLSNKRESWSDGGGQGRRRRRRRQRRKHPKKEENEKESEHSLLPPVQYSSNTSAAAAAAAVVPISGTTRQRQRRKALIFVHIPKTGGSAVEAAGWRNNIRWGSLAWGESRSKTLFQSALKFSKRFDTTPWHATPCMLQQQRHTMNIYYSSSRNKTHINNHNLNKQWYPPKGNDYNDVLRAASDASDADAAASDADADTDAQKTNNGSEEEEHYDLFTVVRNPYERAVSEYRYKRLLIGKEKKPSVTKMNQFIGRRLQTMDQAIRTIESKHLNKCHMHELPRAYLMDGGHWIPQYEYVYNHHHNKTITASAKTRAIQPPQEWIIRHVIRYENISKAFEELAAAYYPEFHTNNNWALGKKSKGTRTHMDRPGDKVVTVENLSSDNIRLINRVYAKDFAAFGYPRRKP